ncbi:MAG TPA: OmpA family protein [Bacteroidia bacterium]|jgi:outer membrane protein OmpA-like peptidoglycan-associated protein|nr:OmpA family protein [Bacteroidia bacterium]
MQVTKLFYTLIFFIISQFAFGQNSTYSNLLKKADHFYRTKNYKNSALNYSQAFKQARWKVPLNDRYNAACAWALANNSDSAFVHLNHIVLVDHYTNNEQLTTEHDLISLHKDKRWKTLLSNIQKNIREVEAKLNKPLMKQLDSIYDEDQAYRGQLIEIEKKFGRSSQEMKSLWNHIHKADSINRVKILTIIDSLGWLGTDVIGEKGNATLFLVIQHSSLQTQQKYLPIMKEAVKNGKAYANDLALLEDRVALATGKKQIYGSQITRDSITNNFVIAPIEDEINVDKRRTEVGLEPLEKYVKAWGIIYKSESTNNIELTNPNVPVEIRDSINPNLNVSRNNGSNFTLQFNGTSIEQKNLAWFKLEINHDSLLTFDIVPENFKNDYDFALFKCLSNDCINDLLSKKIKPERYCLSINELKNGSTGLSEYSQIKFIGPGPGSGYAAAIPVKAGETYYLMLTFPEYYWRKGEAPKGFTIYFYNYWPQKKVSVFKSLLFESNNSLLSNESYPELDKLVTQMNTNKSMKIEIRGYTDNVGDEIKNKELSEKRAKAAADYIISKNINSKRVIFKGLGSENPVTSNDTEEGRKKNRRVDFVMISH